MKFSTALSLLSTLALVPSSMQESQSFNFGSGFGGVAAAPFGVGASAFGPFGTFGSGIGVRNIGGVGIGAPFAGAVGVAAPVVEAVPAVPAIAPAVAAVAGPIGTSSYFSLGAPAVAAVPAVPAVPGVAAIRGFPAVPAGPVGPAPLAYGADYAAPTPYNYGYGVSDPVTGSNFGANEESDGLGNTAGEYRVLLPDGRTQIVTYSVNGPSGFQANVRYEGVAAVAPVGPAYGPAYRPY